MIWHSIFPLMHHTSPNHVHEDTLEGTTTSACYHLTRKSDKPPTPSQWTNPHRVQNSKTCGGISFRIRSLGTSSLWSYSCTLPHQSQQTRFSPITKPNKNRYFRFWRYRHYYGQTKKVQGNWYAILWDEVKGKTKWFLRIMETRKSKMGDYFTKHHPKHHNK